MRRLGFHGTRPSERWDTGLMVGTGSIGASLFEYGDGHAVALSHERFFVQTGPTVHPPILSTGLVEARSELASAPLDDAAAARIESSISAAWAQAGHDGSMVNTDPLLPIGWLVWLPAGSSLRRTYVRSADWPANSARVEWTDDEAVHTVSILADRERQKVEVDIRSDAPLSGTLDLRVAEDPRPGENLNVAATDRGTSTRSLATASDGLIELDTASRFRPDTGVYSGHVSAVVRHDGGSVVPEGNLLRILDVRALSVDISVTVQTVDGEIIGGRAAGRHKELVELSTLDLGSGDDRPVEEILEDADSDQNLVDRARIELAYAAGRNAIIASTGALPPTLQGVWSGSWAPAWSSDYTMNGNVQNGSIASVAATGAPELLRAFFDSVAEHAADYEENAQSLFNAPGYLLPARYSTHGLANHFNSAYPHQYWMGSGGWVLRFAWDYFSLTADEDFLSAWAWPFAQKVMEFYQAVAPKGRDGSRHLAPAYSPENWPGNQASAIAADATGDVAMIRDAAILGARIARILGHRGVAESWERFAAELPAYRVTPEGLLAEWIDPRFDDRTGHRHSTHLYELWYEPERLLDDPRLVEAARKAIRARIDWRAHDPTAPPGHMEMAFGLVQLGVAAAAIGDADSALQCVQWLVRLHWRSNMMPTHDAGVIFNVDAGGGLPAVVVAMLIRSNGHTVTLLPALPAAWPTGEITGLRLRGGLRVERLAWSPDAIELDVAAVPDSAATRLSDRIAVRLPWNAVAAGDDLSKATYEVALGNGLRQLRFRRSVTSATSSRPAQGPSMTAR
ncbi:glycosyl hydrolase family 95 catalytic domain-containing protein [Kribbella sp. CA-245084]|uniref:glycosyl hydrolase family 95 catalytic domain-containing protein n=1 Tax=Kribbella sp. CA-245084 TaxID=3239940 RepID=UPI003D8F7559